MTNLNAILGPLLLRNDCVILPAFGGFVSSYVSAKIDVKNGLITPPSKALSFNKNITSNDGLIIHYLAKEKDISFGESQQILTKEIHQIKAELDQGKRVHFHNVGHLYLNESGKIAFEQDRFFNLLLSSYGLGNVQFISEEIEEVEENQNVLIPATTKEVEIPTTASIETKEKQVEVRLEVEDKNKDKIVQHPAAEEVKSRSLFSKIAKYAAVAALVPVVFYSFWIPMKTDVLTSRIIYSADFNPFIKTGSANYKQEKAPLALQEIEKRETFLDNAKEMYPSVDIFTFPIDDDLQITVQKETELEIQEAKQLQLDEAIKNLGNYHLIVGCFTSQENANNLIATLKAKGFDAYQVDVKGGLHRVSAGSTNAASGLANIRHELKNMNLSSWVLKK